MPKVKSRGSITKRFKVTKRGKLLRRHSFSSHLREKKSKNKKRAQKRPVELKGHMARKIRKVLGITLKK